MNIFCTNEANQQNLAVEEPEVLTTERLDAIFSDMDEKEKNQVRMIAHMQSISIHTAIELFVIERQSSATAFDDMPMFSLMQ